LGVGSADVPYPGYCRQRSSANLSGSYAWRLQTRNTTISFIDQLQGRYTQDLAKDVGDFVVRRRNGAFAYHLATVVDDHDAGVTHVVRGVDLLASTPRQMYLQQVLGLRRPEYGHIPVLVGANGKKLSKSADAESVDAADPRRNLFQLLVWLEQQPPRTLVLETVETILKWAIESWRIDRLRGRTDISIVESRARDTEQRIKTGETTTR
jgi:glutamyl-Q tRNA(Asp) synthetase